MSELDSAASKMVIKHTARLEPEPEMAFKMKACELARESELETATVNRSPRMTAAACVYLTSLARGADYVQGDICEAFDCSAVGLREAYRNIAEGDGWKIKQRPNGATPIIQSTGGRVMNGASQPDKVEVDRLVGYFQAIRGEPR